MKRFYYIIYKTVNLVNGKYYIGKHKTVNPDDSYLGSGVSLSSAIKKHGKQNFVKEILFVFDNELAMNLKESELVTKEIVDDPLSYNMALGGQGGNLGPEINKKIGHKMSQILKGKVKSESHRQSLRETDHAKNYRPTQSTKNRIGQTIKLTWDSMTSEERKIKCGKSGEKNSFYGKNHKVESLEKIRKTIGDSRKGPNNPNAKPITVYGVTYATRKECLDHLGINKRTLYKILGETQWH